MAGGLPTGDNPAYISPTDFSIVGAGAGALNTRTEVNVRAALQDTVIHLPSLTELSGQVFAGINAQLGIVAGIIEAFFRRLIGSIPFVDLDALDSATEQILDQLDTWGTNLRSFFDNLNFLSPTFDPVEAVTQFVDAMIYPLRKFADLIDEIIPPIQIPGIDASKITSGVLVTTTIPDITRDMSSGVQSTVDSLNQAINGGDQEGTDPASLIDSFRNIPAENVLIPPDPVSVITQVSVGDGNWSNTELAGGGIGLNPYITTTWDEDVDDTADMMIIPIVWRTGATRYLYNLSRSVQVGGAGLVRNAFSLGVVTVDPGNCYIEYFALRNPPTGMQPVVVTVFDTLAYGPGVMISLAGESASYYGVYRADFLSGAGGTGTAWEQVVTSLTGRVVVYAAAADDPGATLTWAGDGTEIYNVPSGADVGFIVGDAAGAATVTFDVTSSASVMWASGAIQLLPSPLDALGSGLIVARTLTGTSTIVSGNQTFPTTWYDLVIGQTDDLIWDPVNNRVYFTRAGWYMVSNSVLGDGTTPGTQTRTRALIYQNSSVAALDARADVANSSIGFLGSSICVPVYCSAGDYIEPGIWASGSNGLDITGESTATLCQFKVSLMNRSLA